MPATVKSKKPILKTDYFLVSYAKISFDTRHHSPFLYKVRIYYHFNFYNEDDFYFEFKTLEEVNEFISCAISVSLFRSNQPEQTEFYFKNLPIAEQKYPELFLSNACSLPIKHI